MCRFPDPADAESCIQPTLEVRALVEFTLLYSEGCSWPSRGGKGDSFWVEAGQYVQKAVNSKYCRSGEPTSVMSFARKHYMYTHLHQVLHVESGYSRSCAESSHHPLRQSIILLHLTAKDLSHNCQPSLGALLRCLQIH